MYKAPSFGLGMKKDLRESIESVYNINNSINEEEQLIISLFEEFLEENFHVEMLTEEDLDYVFENEFPQWLEEQTPTRIENRGKERVPQVLSADEFKRRLQAQRDTEAIQKKLDDIRKSKQPPTSKRTTRSIGQKQPQPPTTPKPTLPGEDAQRERAKAKAKSDSNRNESDVPYADEDETDAWKKANKQKVNTEDDIRKNIEKAKKEVNAKTSKTPANKPRKQVRRSAPKPQSFGALLRKVGGNAPATSDTAAGRRKIKLLDARAKARTAAKDAMVRKTGRGQLSWAKAAFNQDGN